MVETMKAGRASRILFAGDTALVVEFGDTVDRHVNALVLEFADRVERAAISGVEELVPTFRSLMVHYEPLLIEPADLTARLKEMIAGLEAADMAGLLEHSGRLWRMPTCYDEAVAPDLAEVAARTGLTPSQVVDCHSAETYHVYMLGYLPGFPYMGNVPSRLVLPKLATPRLKVPVGGIAIAGEMTAVYPMESPGGWYLIGRTPVPIWDLRRDPPALIAPGDKVEFVPVSLDAFAAMAARAAEGALTLAPEVFSGDDHL
jgi:KipI family sensor histidine kinase inhibitor